jgi:hypothetical protein
MSKQLGLDKALDTYDMINAARRKGKNGGLYYDFDLASAVNATPKTFSQKFPSQSYLAFPPFGRFSADDFSCFNLMRLAAKDLLEGDGDGIWNMPLRPGRAALGLGVR